MNFYYYYKYFEKFPCVYANFLKNILIRFKIVSPYLKMMRKHLWKIPHIYQLMFNIFDIEYTIRMNTLSSLKLNKHIVIVQVESINHFIAFKHAFLNPIIEQNFFTSLCTKFIIEDLFDSG